MRSLYIMFLSVLMSVPWSNQASGQTIYIGPNKYAFQYSTTHANSSAATNYGLFFNVAKTSYEFKNSAADAIFSVNAVTNDIQSLGQLTISKNSGMGAPHLLLYEDDSEYARINFRNNVDPDKYWGIASAVSTTDADSRINFYYRKNAASGSNVMSITGEGRVGIGTTSPDARFTIRQAADSDEQGIRIVDASGVRTARLWMNGNDLHIQRGSNSQNGMVLTGGGKAGLFTDDPTALLEVYQDNSSSSTDLFRLSRYYALGPSTIDAFKVDGSGDAFLSNDMTVYGSIKIGSKDANGYRLAVDGKVICEELTVEMSDAWPDFVFDDGYDLMSLEEVEAFIRENRHLPGIPSASVVEEEGVHFSFMARMLMQKVEELTLHTIRQERELEAQRKEIESLKGTPGSK